jgi:hypothetical protein
MPKRRVAPRRTGNRILDALTPESRARLESRSRPISVRAPQVLVQAGARLLHIYFPLNCAMSLLAVAESGEAVETASIGNEGAFGLLAGLSSQESSPKCIVQLDGTAL